MVNTVLCMISRNDSQRLYIIQMKRRFETLEDNNLLISTFKAMSVWPPCLSAFFVKLNVLLLLSVFVTEFPEAIHHPCNKKKTSLYTLRGQRRYISERITSLQTGRFLNTIVIKALDYHIFPLCIAGEKRRHLFCLVDSWNGQSY